MILQAREELDIDLSLSILIGDKASDIEAGEAAGVGTLLHFTPSYSRHGNQIDSLFDAILYLDNKLC